MAERTDVYLIHHNGTGALVKLNTGATTADRFGEIQRSFAALAGSTDSNDYAEMIRLDPQQAAEGVLYDWELAGPDGASYRLVRFATTPDEQIERAKAFVRRSFDVVRLRVLNIHKLVDFAA